MLDFMMNYSKLNEALRKLGLEEIRLGTGLSLTGTILYYTPSAPMDNYFQAIDRTKRN